MTSEAMRTQGGGASDGHRPFLSDELLAGAPPRSAGCAGVTPEAARGDDKGISGVGRGDDGVLMRLSDAVIGGDTTFKVIASRPLSHPSRLAARCGPPCLARLRPHQLAGQIPV